jgi:predicted RNA-binding protein (virulence factor B family)
MGYIKTIREDGKIDVTLQKQGFVQNIDEFKQKILDKLEENYGLLYLTDDSSEEIKEELQMSKKKISKKQLAVCTKKM